MTQNAMWTIYRNAREANGARGWWSTPFPRIAGRWADLLLLSTGCL